MNKITLSGVVINGLNFSHECYGESFYEFDVESYRTSGVADNLKCLVSETLADKVVSGGYIEVNGEIRTRNVLVSGKNKTEIFAFVSSVSQKERTDKNCVELIGYICKKPTHRITPLGREISDFIVASNRERSSKSDYIPCITWGRSAFRVSEAEVGTKIRVLGRLQSREYVKKLEDGTEETRVAYEISVSSIFLNESEE